MKYHLQLQQVCNVCVCVSEHMSAYEYGCVQTMLTRSIASQHDWKE